MKNVDFTSDATESVFTFPDYLSYGTANKYMLLATAGYAALEGAPVPDYILADGFVGTDGDTLWYGPSRNYDKFVFGEGDLPTDGIGSIHLISFSPDEFTVGVNSPKNFLGETGTIDVRPTETVRYRRGDCDDDGERTLTDAVFLLGALFLTREPLVCQDACDANDDSSVNLSDAVKMLVSLFSDGIALPAPANCDVDPTSDGLGCGFFSGCV